VSMVVGEGGKVGRNAWEGGDTNTHKKERMRRGER